MEEEKNLERREFVDEGLVPEELQNLSLRHLGESGGSADVINPTLEPQNHPPGEEEDLAASLLQSFSSEGDDDVLQNEYDMLSSCNASEALEERMESHGEDGEILNGVYFDKLELELSSIERAMSQFEGRLDLLREQAQDLLHTIQNDRSVAKAETDQYSSGDFGAHVAESLVNEESPSDTHRFEQGDGKATELA